jgi:hypothetical protein
MKVAGDFECYLIYSSLQCVQGYISGRNEKVSKHANIKSFSKLIKMTMKEINLNNAMRN